MRSAAFFLFLLAVAAALPFEVAHAQSDFVPTKKTGAIRIATYNVSLNRPEAGKLSQDLKGSDEQAAAVAAVIRSVKPDLLLLNEIDYSASDKNAEVFEKKYLANSEPDALGSDAWSMPYIYTAPVNTGIPSDRDLDMDNKPGEPDDAWGYGRFPGQYGMAILSRYPIDASQVRTFQNFLWSQLPNAKRPQAPESEEPFHDDATWEILRLSSKSFWDVPVITPSGTVHLLASHPTPPAFDGPEDRNGCRNHDEIKLIELYLDGSMALVDDQGQAGGLEADAMFAVLGDLNSDPNDGGSKPEAIQALIQHPSMANFEAPQSEGARAASTSQAAANLRHTGDPANDTADFNDRSVGNLRVDYVLPSSNCSVQAAGVFWPTLDSVNKDQREAIKKSLDASDHHLVWVDVLLP